MTHYQTLLWTDLTTGEIHRSCLCEHWKSEVLRDSPENRQRLIKHAQTHMKAAGHDQP
jgi:hypothetical protein